MSRRIPKLLPRIEVRWETNGERHTKPCDTKAEAELLVKTLAAVGTKAILEEMPCA
jgi:hypothetical protein